MSYYENPPYYLSAYAIAVKHGYTGTEEEWINEIQETAKQASADAAQSAQAAETAYSYANIARQSAEQHAYNAGSAREIAEEKAGDAEAWAYGTRNGEPVESTDPAYHKNSRYYYDHISEPVAGRVDAWIADNLLQEEGYVLDRSLSSAVEAAPADIVGVLDSFFGTERVLNSDIFVSGSGYSDTGKSIVTDPASARTQSFSLAASPAWKIYMDDATYKIVYGFKYKSDIMGNSVEQIANNVSANTVLYIKTDPEKPVVRFSFVRVDGEDLEGDDLDAIIAGFKVIRLTDTNFETSGVPADAKATGTRIDAVESIFLPNHLVSSIVDGGLSSNGLHNSTVGRARTSFFNTIYYPRLKIYVDNSEVEEPSKRIHIVNGFKYAKNVTPADPGNLGTRITPPGNMAYDSYVMVDRDFEKPYIKLSFAYEDNTTAFTAEDIENLMTKYLRIETAGGHSGDADLLSEAQRLGLHTVPENDGVLNAIKNSRQITDIKWTPAADLGRVQTMSSSGDEGYVRYMDKYLAGVEYKGIPYSGILYNDPGMKRRSVGIFRTLETYVTAAAEPRSALFGESRFVRWNTYAYYGNVCVHIPCYAFGWPSMQSSEFSQVPFLSKVFDVYDDETGEYNDLTNLALCDVLVADSGSHVAMITDLEYNDDDTVYRIEVSEQTTIGSITNHVQGGKYGNLARRKFFTPAELYKRFKNYAVYRYGNIADTEYRPSRYAPPSETDGDEMPPIYFPCIPYEGNNTWLVTSGGSRTVRVLINAIGGAILRVYKNGEIFAEYDITNAPEYVDVVCNDDEAEYEATIVFYVTEEGQRESQPCGWLITGPLDEEHRDFVYTTANNIRTYTYSFYRGSDLFRPTYVNFGFAKKQYMCAKIRDLTVTPVGDKYRYTFKFDYPTAWTGANQGIEYGVTVYSELGKYGARHSEFSHRANIETDFDFTTTTTTSGGDTIIDKIIFPCAPLSGDLKMVYTDLLGDEYEATLKQYAANPQTEFSMPSGVVAAEITRVYRTRRSAVPST